MSTVPTGRPLPADAYGVRPAWAEVDLGAVRHNAAVLSTVASPARLCAVVKAGGYGHGALEVARAALAGGAAWLAVALVEEGRDLRAGGVTAPVLILSEPPPSAMKEVVSVGLTPTVYTSSGLDALRRAVDEAGAVPFPVHVKVDTGMRRVGAEPAEAVELACEVAADSRLTLEGFWTHFAVADEVDHPFTGEQVRRFRAALDALSCRGVQPAIRHAANSGGALWHPEARFDMVRCGISLYGLSPSGDRPQVPGLRAALALKARVSYVKTVPAGEGLSYGLRYTLGADSVIATVPLGYADGVPRRLSAVGGEVLIGGRRRRLAGTVTMDQLLVDCGPGADVAAGDEVVLLGRQGDGSIGAWEWAAATDTIAYEVVCAISARVPRVYVDGQWPRSVPPAGRTAAGEAAGG